MVHLPDAAQAGVTPTRDRVQRDDDHALVERMAAGDDRALGALYDRWSTAVHSLAVRVVGDRDEAEDVVEDTFWQLWRQASQYDRARGTVATWVLTAARTRALDRRRAGERRRTDTLSDMEGTSAANAAATTTEGPAEGAEAAERRDLVASALAQLPGEQREVVELAYFGGLSQTEIAERTGQPLGTIKTRVRLAMQKLRDRLAHLDDRAVAQ